MLDFMYMGEVNVAQEELNSFLAVAEDLRVKGKYFSFYKFFLYKSMIGQYFPSFQPCIYLHIIQKKGPTNLFDFSMFNFLFTF